MVEFNRDSIALTFIQIDKLLMLFSLLGPQIVMLLNDVRAITYKKPKMQQHSKIDCYSGEIFVVWGGGGYDMYMYAYKSSLEIILEHNKANYQGQS